MATSSTHPLISNLTLRLRANAGAGDQHDHLNEAAPTSSSQILDNTARDAESFPHPADDRENLFSFQTPSQNANESVSSEKDPQLLNTASARMIPPYLPERPPINQTEERQMVEQATRLSMDEVSQNQPFPTRQKKGISFEQEMNRRISAEMPKIVDPQGDTAVYIDPPPQLPGQDQQAYRKICQHFRLPHIVQSKDLHALESQKIDDMFAPTAQFRMKRRLTKAGCMVTSASSIKFHLDWRVPVDGDDALVLLEGLTCTKGILDWVKAKEYYDIRGTYVHGEDDVELCNTSRVRTEEPPEVTKVDAQSGVKQGKTASETQSMGSSDVRSAVENPNFPVEIPGIWSEDATDIKAVVKKEIVTPVALDGARPKKGELSKSQDAKKHQKPEPVERILNWDGDLPRPPPASEESFDMMPTFETSTASSVPQPKPNAMPLFMFPPQEEYSQLRHRSAIERLLHAACGGDPRLDSAPKVWTYFAVANYFECATRPKVNSWITVWLLDYENANFIQANPEVTYQIGMGIRSDYITRVAFSILAAEKALSTIAGSSLCDRNLAQNSVHRRKVEHLDDDEKNRIDHAANRFLHRIQSLFHSLIDDNMSWLQRCPEYRILVSHKLRYPADAQIVDDLIETLKWYIRIKLLQIQARDYTIEMDTLEERWERVMQFYPLRAPLHFTYNSLPMEARLLTRTFWIAVESATLNETHSSGAASQGLPDLSQNKVDKIQDYLSSMNINYFMSATDVANAAQAFNNAKRLREERARWASDVPDLPELPHQTLEALIRSNASEHSPLHQDGQDQQSSLQEWFRRPWLQQDEARSPPTHEPREPLNNTRDTQYFDFDYQIFLEEAEKALRAICGPALRPQHLWQGTFRLPTKLIDTPLCLSDDEFKYLPLWAGGNDDGETGAVFDETDVPFLESGGFAPGKGVHSDTSDFSSDATSDTFSDIASTAQGTTYRASHKATEGTLDENNADEVGTEVGNMDDVWGDVRKSTNVTEKGKMIELADGSGSESIVMVDGPLAMTGTDDSQRGSHPPPVPSFPGARPHGMSQFGKTTLYDTERAGGESLPESRSTSHHAIEYGGDDIMDEDEYDDDNESEGTAKGGVDSDHDEGDDFDHMELSDDDMGFVEIESGN